MVWRNHENKKFHIKEDVKMKKFFNQLLTKRAERKMDRLLIKYGKQNDLNAITFCNQCKFYMHNGYSAAGLTRTFEQFLKVVG